MKSVQDSSLSRPTESSFLWNSTRLPPDTNPTIKIMVIIILEEKKEMRPRGRELFTIINGKQEISENIISRKKSYKLEGLKLDDANQVADFIRTNTLNRQEKAELWKNIEESHEYNIIEWEEDRDLEWSFDGRKGKLVIK